MAASDPVSRIRLAVLRPEPGNMQTAARIVARGLTAIRLPLFHVMPVAWMPPDPAPHDAVLLTSANAVRHAGSGLMTLATLPVVAVGAKTATAAQAAGLRVAVIGAAGIDDALGKATAAGYRRLLHLTAADRTRPETGDTRVTAITVYASQAVTIAPADAQLLIGSTALLHSVRAAQTFADLVDRAGIARETIRIAALSGAILAAGGTGWRSACAAARPTDDSLITLAADMAQDTDD